MKLTVLVDNNSLIDEYYLAEPALSFYIEDGRKKILFDAGYSNAFILNAKKMGIDLLKVDYIVLSHGHLDHTWGLEHLVQLFNNSKNKKRPTLIAHPLAFKKKAHKKEGNIGSRSTEQALSRHFNLFLSIEPFHITKNLVFLGEIPRKFSFEGKNAIGHVRIGNKNIPDILVDDSALAYKDKNDLTIITGCSHSGIGNIIEHAKSVCNTHKVSHVIGGLHLLDPDKKQMKETLSYFKKLKPALLCACHCTDLASKIALSHVVNIKEVGVGLKLEIC